MFFRQSFQTSLSRESIYLYPPSLGNSKKSFANLSKQVNNWGVKGVTDNVYSLELGYALCGAAFPLLLLLSYGVINAGNLVVDSKLNL